MMTIKLCDENINVLVVARWPLGGIRTYMRYMFNHFPHKYRLTIIAASTQEDSALEKDAEKYNARLLFSGNGSSFELTAAIFKELLRKKYHIILSQGFISSVAGHCANLIFRVPHIITIHGILEPKYLDGRYGWAKRILLEKVLSSMSVHYAVSNDILRHLHEQFPKLKTCSAMPVVIPNGIESKNFCVSSISQKNLKTSLGISCVTFLFGFFGRFMQQKGFDLLIDAVDMLRKHEGMASFAVLAVGSGDYLDSYRRMIQSRELAPFFYFLPFQHEVKELFVEVDTVVMPSRWEASGLLAMEVLSMGIPLVASDCIGLRETICSTPTHVFPSENVDALVKELYACIVNPVAMPFKEYAPHARQRFDVSNSARKLVELIEELH